MAIFIYYVLHIVSVILLTAFTFTATATAAAGKNKRVLMITGILSLTALIGGFGLLARVYEGFPTWIYIKIACWLVLTMGAGMAYRRPHKAGLLTGLVVLAVVVAVVTVYNVRYQVI